MVALIDHKSSVDYNVGMQLLRYMVFIWENYERQMISDHYKGIEKTKEFRYPPILPIVYYEDTDEWTATVNLKDRIVLNDVFGEFIPDYRYLLFKLQDHGPSELIDKGDEISLVMLINRLRDASELMNIRFPDGYFEDISKKAPEDVLIVFGKIIATYLRELNLPEEEIREFTDQIGGVDMNRLFKHFQGYDIQEVRKESRAEGKAEGRTEGEQIMLIRLVCKKLLKNKTTDQIAEELEADIEEVEAICKAAEPFSPEYDAEKIYEAMI